MLRTFLNVLPSSQMDDKYVVDAPFEFQISDVFSVPFVGTVVVCPSLLHLINTDIQSGVITSGRVVGKLFYIHYDRDIANWQSTTQSF